MARSLIGGLLKTGIAASSISVAEPRAEARQELGREFGVACYAEARPAAAEAEVVLLAVKPQVLPALRNELQDLLRQQRPLLISIAAGVRIDQLERWLGGHLPIVRCMPNTPALIGAGATGLCANGRVSPPQRALAQRILDAAGLTRWLEDEALMDTVTALSGSGPAYFFALVEALEDAAVAQGMPRETARAGRADLPGRRPHAGRERRSAGRTAPPRDLAQRHHPGRPGKLCRRRPAAHGRARRRRRHPPRRRAGRCPG